MYRKSIIGDLPRNCRVRFKLKILDKAENYMITLSVTIQFIPIYIMLDYEYKMLVTKTCIGVVGNKQTVTLCQEYREWFNRTLLNKVENYLHVAHDIAKCIFLTLINYELLQNDIYTINVRISRKRHTVKRLQGTV